MTTITSPVPGYTGPGAGGVTFIDGKAETNNEAAINYFRGAGFGVDGEPPAAAPTQVDAREVALTTPLGTAMRDAAVDPQAGDYLPPSNAGQADPHGPQVNAPGIANGGGTVGGQATSTGGSTPTPTSTATPTSPSTVTPPAPPAGGTFDPSEHGVAEVKAYLEALPAGDIGTAERERVLDAERAGKNRTSLTG